MENNETIGAMLIRERERRQLSLDDVHDATKITVHNLAALEEDRFDHFPNRVYARAFLRDYSNFLGLDSGELLEKYEIDWQGITREVSSVPTGRRSPWNAVVVTFLALIALGGIAVGIYFYNAGLGVKMPSATGRHVEKPDVAQLPKPEPIAPVKPEAEKPKPAEKPKAEQPVASKPAPQTLTLEVTASRPVWADIKSDGQKVIYGILPTGVKTITAQKKIFIKVGQANAVSLKLNGQPEKSLGTSANMGKREFVLPQQPVETPVGGASEPASAPASAPKLGG
ncbi:MAG: RodZ domain-containing protein [Armatimonadota bacterium]|nr:DUF4115 domain-containing protein [bacterium]